VLGLKKNFGQEQQAGSQGQGEENGRRERDFQGGMLVLRRGNSGGVRVVVPAEGSRRREPKEATTGEGVRIHLGEIVVISGLGSVLIKRPSL